VAGHYAYTPLACRARRKKTNNQAVEDMCLVFLGDAAVTLASPVACLDPELLSSAFDDCADLPWLHCL